MRENFFKVFLIFCVFPVFSISGKGWGGQDKYLLTGEISDLQTTFSAFDQTVEQAKKGTLKVPNSDVVTDPEKPKFIKYKSKLILKRGESPAEDHCPYAAIVTLVSDDGCNITISKKDGEKSEWLKEKGKGHDISKGQRDYDKILLPGEYEFNVEYSQTYYDPDSGKKDLDGISLIVLPFALDISVMKSHDVKTINRRVLLKKGGNIKMALCSDFLKNPSTVPKGKSAERVGKKIDWYIGRMTTTHEPNAAKWKKVGTGFLCEYTCVESGVFFIKAKIEGMDFLYRRRTEEHAGTIKKWDYDCVGVVDNDREISLINSAYTQMTKYGKQENEVTAYEASWPKQGKPLSDAQAQVTSSIAKLTLAEGAVMRALIEQNGGKDVGPGNYINSYKCNLFIYYHLRKTGFILPLINRRPPLVSEWTSSSSLKTNWGWMKANANTFPQPGWITTNNKHCGIIDYDGYWISGNQISVGKIYNGISSVIFRKYNF